MATRSTRTKKAGSAPAATHTLTVRRIGNSCGLVLPKKVMEDLGVQEGDALFALRSPDGIRLTPYDPEFAEAVDSARDYMRRHRNAMGELARR